MPPKPQSRFRRLLRLGFRVCRMATLLVILVLLGGLIYVNRSGLPEFARRPLLEKLRAHGLDFEMSRLRLRFYRGLVAENVKFGRDENATTPRLTAKNVEVKINYRALFKRQMQVTAVVLDQGRFVWPVADPNASAATGREPGGPPRELVVENIRANLRLLPGDEWALDHFHATFAGADLTLSGSVTNASAIRDWPLLHGQQPAAVTQRRLRRFADTLEKIHFRVPPELRLVLTGDARDLQSFTARLTLTAPDAGTPWGNITHGTFTARLFPATNREPAHAELSLQADDAQTPWATVAGLELDVRLGSLAGQTNLVAGGLTAKAARVGTKWASVTNAKFAANWLHSLTNAIPLSGRGELDSASITTPWVAGNDFRLTATLTTPTNPPPADAAWAWWTNLQPYQLNWSCELSQPDAEKLDAKKVVCAGYWRAPELVVTNLHAGFSDGVLNAHAQLDVATREARFDLTSDFDVKKVSPLLPEKSRRWLDKFYWATPPKLAGHGAVTLPAWTNRQPDWAGEVQPTFWLSGGFAVTNGAYLGVPVDWARSHLAYSNRVWHLPDLEAGRPEGGLRLEHIANEGTKDFYWRVHSTVDVRALRPLLTAEQQRGLDLVTFTAPPVIDGEMWGRGNESDRIGFQGRATLTNFAFREQTADWVETSFRYTNRFLEFLDPRALRGTQTVAAAGIAVDFNAQRIHFTNGFSTAEPLVVTHAIGPHIRRIIEPYRFTRPPTVHVSGYTSLRGSRDVDLRFTVVDGGPFEWLKFKVPQVTGEVHWRGDTMGLTNVAAAFYGGAAAGFAHFDFTPARGSDFNFTLGVTNASLPLLLSDVSPRTNYLEGTLGGRLVIVGANSDDPRSWNGSGRARLHDGLVWELPIFGVLSKPLDLLMPGIAKSRFSDASARFGITNSVITWDKLEMRAPTMRLQYDGTTDFDGRVDMRVEAEPLRDAWVVGRLFSLALWPVTKLFQYQITGTLDHPKSEPVYVPKLLMLPLHPFRTLEDLFTPDPAKTNAPPVFKELPE